MSRQCKGSKRGYLDYRLRFYCEHDDAVRALVERYLKARLPELTIYDVWPRSTPFRGYYSIWLPRGWQEEFMRDFEALKSPSMTASFSTM